MSRTDKDTPEWVRGFHAPNGLIWHDPSCEMSRFSNRVRDARPCDALDETVTLKDRKCTLERVGYLGVRSWGGPPKWYRNATWYVGDRAEVRAQLTAVRFDINSGIDVEPDPRTFQHRHSAAWTWW